MLLITPKIEIAYIYSISLLECREGLLERILRQKKKVIRHQYKKSKGGDFYEVHGARGTKHDQ